MFSISSKALVYVWQRKIIFYNVIFPERRLSITNDRPPSTPLSQDWRVGSTVGASRHPSHDWRLTLPRLPSTTTTTTTKRGKEITPGFKPFTKQGKLTDYKVRSLRKYWSPRRRRATLSEGAGTCAALKLHSSGRCDELNWREQSKTAVVAFEKTEQDETSQYEDA